MEDPDPTAFILHSYSAHSRGGRAEPGKMNSMKIKKKWCVITVILFHCSQAGYSISPYPCPWSRSRSHPIVSHTIPSHPSHVACNGRAFFGQRGRGPWSWVPARPRVWVPILILGSKLSVLDSRFSVLGSGTALLPVETISLKFVRIIMGNFQRTCVSMNISLLLAFKVSSPPLSSFSPAPPLSPGHHRTAASPFFLLSVGLLWLGSSGSECPKWVPDLSKKLAFYAPKA